MVTLNKAQVLYFVSGFQEKWLSYFAFGTGEAENKFPINKSLKMLAELFLVLFVISCISETEAYQRDIPKIYPKY